MTSLFLEVFLGLPFKLNGHSIMIVTHRFGKVDAKLFSLGKSDRSLKDQPHGWGIQDSLVADGFFVNGKTW